MRNYRIVMLLDWSLHVIKMQIFPDLIFNLMEILVKCSKCKQEVFTLNDRLILKFIRKCKGLRIVYTLLEEQREKLII